MEKEPYISVKDLNKIKDIVEYKKLPWENEAYEVQDTIVQQYLKSKIFKSLLGKDANIDFLYDNDALL